jgi:hypothetical protein
MKPTMARERRALGKSILKKKMVERAITRIIHNKIIEVYKQKNVHLSQGLKSSFSCTSIP